MASAMGDVAEHTLDSSKTGPAVNAVFSCLPCRARDAVGPLQSNTFGVHGAMAHGGFSQQT
ncbi:hypothetical protein QC764_0030090 [Podospora pseudoanserina]|uniref:Uncharacterized protein n=1 Tax=Podospora pseudoanserina TaxID=2609844 RepID=A0ABR0IFT0_9PEZI|nr:hypothetical protein QC764_0030090 [Podospora pseudoanserina]